MLRNTCVRLQRNNIQRTAQARKHESTHVYSNRLPVRYLDVLARGPCNTHVFLAAVYVQRLQPASAEQSVQHWPDAPQGDLPPHSQPLMLGGWGAKRVRWAQSAE